MLTVTKHDKADIRFRTFRLEKTTERQNDNCRLFAPKRRQNKKSTTRQNAKRQIQPTNMSSFRMAFCRLVVI
jgi:hypothetical protein